MIREALAKIVAGNDLSEDEAAAVMEELMTDQATPAQTGALLAALSMKGETVDEITGMVRVMREKALHVRVDGDLLDVVSTGGGAFDPFNISTTAAIVCAGAGVRVAKHGNRGYTSVTGAADVLESLGVKLELTPEQAAKCIEQTGFAFLFAQAFHPSMRFVGPTRREIGFRTILNSLGPLTNPADARYQLLGVGEQAMADKVAQVLRRLGGARVFVVHSDDGLDEVSLSAPTTVREVEDDSVTVYTLTPEDAGMERVPLESVATGTKDENAARMTAVLAGEQTPDRDYVLINSAVALQVVQAAGGLREGLEMARASIDSGAARHVLDDYIKASNSFDPG